MRKDGSLFINIGCIQFSTCHITKNACVNAQHTIHQQTNTPGWSKKAIIYVKENTSFFQKKKKKKKWKKSPTFPFELFCISSLRKA